jgi:hypothetical protein
LLRDGFLFLALGKPDRYGNFFHFQCLPFSCCTYAPVLLLLFTGAA